MSESTLAECIDAAWRHTSPSYRRRLAETASAVSTKDAGDYIAQGHDAAMARALVAYDRLAAQDKAAPKQTGSEAATLRHEIAQLRAELAQQKKYTNQIARTLNNVGEQLFGKPDGSPPPVKEFIGRCLAVVRTELEAKIEQKSGGIRHRGSWDAEAEYAANDVVLADGSSFIATVACSGERPNHNPTEPSPWAMLARRGRDQRKKPEVKDE